MTTTAKRKSLRTLIESADGNTIELMYSLFGRKKMSHDMYGLYRDKLPHLAFPANEIPPHIPGVKKPFTAASGSKKTGGKKK